MSGYSKIRVVRTTKSKSIDFSDLFSSSHQNPNLDLTSKTQKPNQTINPKNKITTTHDSIAEQDEEGEGEDGNGERFGVILSRNYSVSTSSSTSTSIPNHQKFEKQKPTTVHQSSLVRRAFSMRRSSSVAEEYCRIHEQLDPISSPPLPTTTTTNEEILTRSKKSKKVKILKVCKRILGF